jgi:hypothetical protein
LLLVSTGHNATVIGGLHLEILDITATPGAFADDPA